jgi:hypothetical protein
MLSGFRFNSVQLGKISSLREVLSEQPIVYDPRETGAAFRDAEDRYGEPLELGG